MRKQNVGDTCVHACSRNFRFGKPEESQDLAGLYEPQARLVSFHQSLLASLLCPSLADHPPVSQGDFCDVNFPLEDPSWDWREKSGLRVSKSRRRDKRWAILNQHTRMRTQK